MDLSLVSIDDMIDEIYSRSDSIVFARIFKTSGKKEDTESVWRGSGMGCIGLLKTFMADLQRDIGGYRVKDGV